MNYINGTRELIIMLTKLIAFSGFSALIGCIERFSLDCRKTKTKVNTLANQRA